uniref:Guanine nucleotide-binding protein subunit gamma n=1 Tax=Hucho hucho TaxID=62062 RepID=A0A4W5MCD4_9TELE
MNRAKYKEILDENLLQSAHDLRLGQRFTFQQDNNPKHTAKTMQEWLRDKSLNVSKAAADLMAYCDAHIRDDPLIVPMPASENPFREKKLFCTIL